MYAENPLNALQALLVKYEPAAWQLLQTVPIASLPTLAVLNEITGLDCQPTEAVADCLPRYISALKEKHKVG